MRPSVRRGYVDPLTRALGAISEEMAMPAEGHVEYMGLDIARELYTRASVYPEIAYVAAGHCESELRRLYGACAETIYPHLLVVVYHTYEATKAKMQRTCRIAAIDHTLATIDLATIYLNKYGFADEARMLDKSRSMLEFGISRVVAAMCKTEICHTRHDIHQLLLGVCPDINTSAIMHITDGELERMLLAINNMRASSIQYSQLM